MRHKYGADLVKGDMFVMAGGHYRILGIYEVADPDMIKYTFCSMNENVPGNFSMTISKELLFIIQ